MWRRATNRGPRQGGLASGSQQVVYFARAVVELFGDRAGVDRLIARGLDVRGSPGGEARRLAAVGGHLDTARSLDAGAPVNHVGVNVWNDDAAGRAIQTRMARLRCSGGGAVEWVD